MDSSLLPPATAIVDRQSNFENDIGEVKLRQIWRWLDAIHDREPPEEQPAFDDSDEPQEWVQDQEYTSKALKPTQSYGHVQILKRSPPSGLSNELYTNIETHSQAVLGKGDYKVQPTSSDRGKAGNLGRLLRSRTLAERAKDIGSPEALYPPTADSQSWVHRIRAKSATHRFFKHIG